MAVQAGWSPTYTLTEDFALGMELKKRNWSCRYVCDYLAIGEAPDQIRNCFQQRSRWTKVSQPPCRALLLAMLCDNSLMCQHAADSCDLPEVGCMTRLRGQQANRAALLTCLPACLLMKCSQRSSSCTAHRCPPGHIHFLVICWRCTPGHLRADQVH